MRPTEIAKDQTKVVMTLYSVERRVKLIYFITSATSPNILNKKKE